MSRDTVNAEIDAIMTLLTATMEAYYIEHGNYRVIEGWTHNEAPTALTAPDNQWSVFTWPPSSFRARLSHYTGVSHGWFIDVQYRAAGRLYDRLIIGAGTASSRDWIRKSED